MAIIPWIILICWAALILTWIVTSFGVKRDVRGGVWWRSWTVRTIIIALVLAVVWHSLSIGKFTYHLGLAEYLQSRPLAALAAILCISGIILAIWARLHLGRNWSPAPAIKEGHELVTSGPYRYIRHPIYTGILMAMLGSALATPTWIIVLIIFGIMFVRRVKREEALMMRQFPDQYPEYKKRTWALVPYVW